MATDPVKVSVITPTADRPFGIRLLERYMSRQTMLPDEWIVADDGNEPAELTMGQLHVRRPRQYDKGRSLATNLIRAVQHVTGDIVVIMEDDDWYAPNHIEHCVKRLEQERKRATGSMTLRYYNVAEKKFVVMRNRGSALCNTACRADVLHKLEDAANKAFEANDYSIDNRFWTSIRQHDQDVHNINTVVGIKGLPGRIGLGIGHRPDARRRWHRDPEMKKLSDWIGEDWRNYSGLTI